MIGLLQCDHVGAQFLEHGGDYDEMFQRWLPGQWRIYDVASGEIPENIQECDGYVSTGSRASVYDDDVWIHRFAGLIRTIHAANVPMIGVCFGHQMISHALGGRVQRCSRGWGIGVQSFSVKQHEPWMRPRLRTFSLLMSCQDQVETLPSGAVVLAGNDQCPVGMFRVGSLLGVQGHPEFSPSYAEALMRSRTFAIGPDRVKAALATMQEPLHSAELSAWALQFLAITS
jgi:GMP synthase-like glutamine amidotransferase